MYPRMVRRLALYAFSALLCACSATKQTEVVISVASDLPIPQEIDEVGLAVSYADDDQEIIDLSWQLDQNQPDAITLPARFGVLAGKDPSRVVRYVVSAIRGGKPFLDRRAALPFARDRIIFLRMNLLSQCVGVTCSANETCGETGCEKIDKNPPDLPEYTPEQENNGHDARAADG
ncbi:MAG: hypothetical protein KC503_18450, partial [Myxococcales bacterium]|nr:hypothetical protein [Myxococcales bacterium]